MTMVRSNGTPALSRANTNDSSFLMASRPFAIQSSDRRSADHHASTAIAHDFARVSVGANLRLPSAQSTTNQMDAGVAPAGPEDAGPRDAAPIAGAPQPPDAGHAAPAAPTPAQPARPVTPPTVTFGKVAIDARFDRIPPTKSLDIDVTVNGLAAGASAAIDVEGSGGVNGTASVTVGASLAASGKVTVRGGAQTSPGNAGNLRLRAQVGGAVVGRSNGFTVAAWPIDYTDTFVADIDTPASVGLQVQDGWSSDGTGAIAELDQVKLSERVDIQRRDNPPFTGAGGTSATSGTSGYLNANALTGDSHAYARALINTAGLGRGTWNVVYGQLSIFKCNRTGVLDLVMPASGYTIAHRASNLPLLGWQHLAVKAGAGVTVEGRTATAGGGTASSSMHTL